MVVSIDRLRQVLHYDPATGHFTWKVMRPSNRLIGTRAGTISTGRTKGYFKISIDGKIYYAHRLAWLYMTGQWPSEQIDHINGIPGDDRFCNLREATHAENQRNCRLPKHNTSGHKGVSWRKAKDKWYAYIKINRRMISLGFFEDFNEATAARAIAAIKYHGEFARV